MTLPASPFPSTHWSLLARTALDDEKVVREALNKLCKLYAEPVRSYYRSLGLRREDAEDLSQILLSKMVEQRIWLKADFGRGRFRRFLMAVARYSWLNWRRSESSVRRGNGVVPESLDMLQELNADPPAPDDPATLRFDREWALQITRAAWKSLESEYAGDRESLYRFSILKQFMPGANEDLTPEQAAEQLDITAVAARAQVHRFRERYHDLVRQIIRDTLTSAHDVDDELAYLVSIIGSSSNEIDLQDSD